MTLDDALAAFAAECEARVTPKLELSRSNAALTHSPAALARSNVPRADAARAADKTAATFSPAATGTPPPPPPSEGPFGPDPAPRRHLRTHESS